MCLFVDVQKSVRSIRRETSIYIYIYIVYIYFLDVKIFADFLIPTYCISLLSVDNGVFPGLSFVYINFIK